MLVKTIKIFSFGCCLLFYQLLYAGEWSGYIAAEGRYYPKDPLQSVQHGNNLSLSAQPEYYQEWDEGQQSMLFIPFARIDQGDEERSHTDIRELVWLKVGPSWELRAGIGKVFWGVVESQHLVDIINQTDLVENQDGEDKLGQPLMNLTLLKDWGVVDFFILPGFRERTFPGEEGRLRFPLRVDTDNPVYQSQHGNNHIDVATRWSHTLDNWDIGLSYFAGTNREPYFISGIDGAGNPVLLPVYELIRQAGLDVQLTLDAWLWKLEAIVRANDVESLTLMTGGFEYTYPVIFGTNADLGLLVEYLYDERGVNAPGPFNNDVLIGTRLVLNDVQSSELLAGVIFDLDNDATAYNIEASRRLGEQFKINLEARAYTHIPATDPLYSLRNDGHLQLELAYYF